MGVQAAIPIDNIQIMKILGQHFRVLVNIILAFVGIVLVDEAPRRHYEAFSANLQALNFRARERQHSFYNFLTKNTSEIRGCSLARYGFDCCCVWTLFERRGRCVRRKHHFLHNFWHRLSLHYTVGPDEYYATSSY